LISVRIEQTKMKSVAPGDNLIMHFPADRLNVFDARSGRRM